MNKLIDPTRYALGLPAGSVRAIVVLILAIGVVAAVLATLAISAELGNVPAGVAALIALAGPILTQYAADSQNRQPPSGPPAGS